MASWLLLLMVEVLEKTKLQFFQVFSTGLANNEKTDIFVPAL